MSRMTISHIPSSWTMAHIDLVDLPLGSQQDGRFSMVCQCWSGAPC